MLINNQSKSIHPLASEIPIGLWDNIFKSRLNTIDLKVDKKLVTQVTVNDLPNDSEQAFIILLLSYPKAEAGQLIDFAQKELHLSVKSIFITSCALGKMIDGY